MKKVLFLFTFLFSCFFSSGVAFANEYDFSVDTTWLNKSDNSVYEYSGGCISDDSRKFFYNYKKIDSIIPILKEKYDNFFITTNGYCDTKVNIYVWHDEYFNPYINLNIADWTRAKQFLIKGNSGFKYITKDISDLDDFDINELLNKNWGISNDLNINVYFTKDKLLYYSSYDIKTKYTNPYATDNDIINFTFNKTKYTLQNRQNEIILPTIYEQLHPKPGYKFNKLPVLDENNKVVSIDVEVFPTIINDNDYYYMFSHDKQLWHTVQFGSRASYVTNFKENGVLYAQLWEIKNDMKKNYFTYNVDGIGLTKEEYEDLYGTIEKYGEGSEKNDNIFDDDDYTSRILPTYFEFLKNTYGILWQLPSIFQTYQYNVSTDSDCFTHNRFNDGLHMDYCSPFDSISINLSKLGINKIYSFSYMSDIYWRYRDEIFFWIKLLLGTYTFLFVLKNLKFGGSGT